ncbi:MAG: site-specific integrase [Prevotellaceae bacterium]|jgi:site-specific recombinase XerD|nr:site-specific integrase [Prevotellaceae bacterium]
MATFKVVSRTAKEYNTVYIRIIHKSASEYIRTELTVHKSGIDKKKEVKDFFIISQCSTRIKDYVLKLNTINSEPMTIREIKNFLVEKNDGVSFTDYARKFIGELSSESRHKAVERYKTALNSLKKHYKRENIMFSEITSNDLRDWIKSLSKTARAKAQYPICIKKIFDEGCNQYNDYDRNIIRITNQPFRAVKIPQSDPPKKRFADVELVRKIFEIEPQNSREELAADVCKMVIYLAGMNLIDLYNIEKQEFKNGKFCYNRTKEETQRKDKAYFEIKVPGEILPLIEKYNGKKHLFSFRDNYSNNENFRRAVTIGLKSICRRAEVTEISYYWLRHTWATVARNKCGFSEADVAFGLNHASAHKATEFYIEKDFSPVDVMNEKVLKYIFNF